MKCKKVVIGAALAASMVAGCVVGATATNGSVWKEVFYRDITVTLNGNQVTPVDGNGNPLEPCIMDGMAYLPIRGVASMLGIDASWDGNTNTIALSQGGNSTASTSAQTVAPSAPAASASSEQWGSGYLKYAYVEVTGFRTGVSRYGDSAVIIKYSWTNYGEEENSIFAIDVSAFQNGVELKSLNYGLDTVGNISAKVKPGGTYEVEESFILSNSYSPVNFEIKDNYMRIINDDKSVRSNPPVVYTYYDLS